MSVTLNTSIGGIKIEIACDLVPRLSRNFLILCASGYYDGTVFHRVLRGFIAQAGDPTGTGKGGRAANGGFEADELSPLLKHDRRGTVAMANKNRKDTNGSQFYITLGGADKTGHLDGNCCVIGHVIDGWDVLDTLERGEVDAKGKPLNPVVIKSVTIHANPLA